MTIDTYLQKLPFYNQRWFQYVYFLIKNFLDDNCTQKASSLTYTTLLSIVPILTVLLVMLSSIPSLAAAKEQIQNLIYSNLLPSSSVQVAKYFNEFAEKSSNLTFVGVAGLFVTTLLTLNTIQSAFNEIWRVEQKPMNFKSLLAYWAIVTLGPLLLGTAFIVSSTVQSLSFLNQSIGGYGIDWAVWVQAGSVVAMTLGFVAMYWFVPRCKVRFKYALIAGVIVGLIFEGLKQTFGVVMSNFTSYEKIYGAFAAVPIFLMWVYLSWNIILLGVEISYSLTVFETKEVYPRHPLLSLMDMLNVVYRHHQKGEAVSEMDLRNVLGRKEMPHWYRYIRYLQDNNLIGLDHEEKYILKHPLTHYTFWDFYQNLPYPLPHGHDLQQIQRFDPWMQAWVGKLAESETMLKHNFSIGLAEIFDKVPPRKDPLAKGAKTAKNYNPATTSQTNPLASSAATATHTANTGLTGGQISDVTHDNRTIEETQIEKDLTIQSNQEAAGKNGLAKTSVREAGLEKSPSINTSPTLAQQDNTPQKPLAKWRRLLGFTKFPIITEADKPEKQ